MVKIISWIIVTDLEISSALQRSSVSAQQAGVSFEELASMITVVSDVSRRAPESIGEAFKTMFARYQDILQGGVDEEGMGINNVGKALERVGINIRDAEGGFRDFSDVLDDLYPKWQSLGEVEQANILKSMAGTRQRESLLILLENQTKYMKGLEVQTDSTGKALERYDEYLGGVEASQNKMNASWERLAQNSISSTTISGFYNALAGILDFIDAIGGLPTILSLTGIGLVIAYGGAISFAGALGILETALLAVEATMIAMNPAAWALVAIGAVLMFVNTIETSEEKLKRLNTEIEEHTNKINSLRDSSKSIMELSSKYEELNEVYKDSGVMSQEFLDVQNQLKELVPTLSGYFDDYGNFILDDTNKMGDLTKATLEQIAVEKKLRRAKLDESAGVNVENLLDIQRKKRGLVGRGGFGKSESEKLQINLDWSKAIEESKTAFSQMSEEGKESFIKALGESGENGATLAAEVFAPMFRQSIVDQWTGKDDIIPSDKAEENGANAGIEMYKGLSETIKSLMDTGTDELIGKSMKGELGFGDIEKIPEEYLSALTVEGDKLRLNISLVKEKQIEDAKLALQSAVNADAAQSEIAVLQLYYDQLLTQSEQTYGAFNQTAWQYDELLWTISNDAIAAGYSFMDMEGNALNSAQSIYDYMSKSDANFNDFVRQAALATGLSTEEIMTRLGMAVQKTYNYTADAVAKMAALVNSVKLPGSSMYNIGLATSSGASNLGSLNLFSNPPQSTSTGSGGGGGSSSSSGETAADRREAKRLAKLKEIEDAIAKARKEATDDLKDQLNLYKDMVDERKKILDSMVEERNYQQDLEENQSNVANIQNQIAELSLDDSDEARAQVLALQEQLATAQQDLANLEYEHGIEQQKTALDTELERVSDLIDAAIASIEGINATSLDSFTSQLATILASMATAVPTFHSGVNAGFVGGKSDSKENEQFAKLLKGEIVINPEQMSGFMNKTLPNLMQSSPNISSNMKGMEIGTLMSFNITGSMDKSILPNIESLANKVVEKLNNNMLLRGTKRSSNLFSS